MSSENNFKPKLVFDLNEMPNPSLLIDLIEPPHPPTDATLPLETQQTILKILNIYITCDCIPSKFTLKSLYTLNI